MLDPDYILHVSEGAEELASLLHTEIMTRIIERIMARIGNGAGFALSATDKWQLEVLRDAGYLMEDIQKVIAKYTGLQASEIRDAMLEAGVRAISYDDAIYKAAGLSPMPIMQSPYFARILQRNYEITMGEWNNYTRTTAAASYQAFIRACDKAYALTTSGTISYSQAVLEAINEVISDGTIVKYYKTDSDGNERLSRVDTLETATLRAVRTGISQATGAISIARMEEMDWDIVLTSAHMGARTGDGGENPTNHYWWQGRFFSRTGRNKQFPDFVQSTGYGSITGLCGINCRHNFGPGDGKNNPWEKFDASENQKVEEINKRQRELERRIRKTKQEVMELKTAMDNATSQEAKDAIDAKYQKKSALLGKQNEAYRQFCKENDLKPLEHRLAVAKWDREQAKEAMGAVKRYEKQKKK